ncbi:MAG TPA: hypothetical protein VNJ08_06835 [Bacteriovoracaceae bacterium]|nr:hypothetical protein [Bacteriovoracaceae bacterium]
MNPYKKFLSKDPKLKSYLEREVFIPSKSRDITIRLVWSILSQQLSIKVAKVLHQRFLDLYEKKPTAQMIIETPYDKLKSIGISHQKTTYIHNVARFIVDNKVTAGKLDKMSDDEVIEFLSQIKGVGRWTVEMLMIFAMGREDVFAVDDLGIQKEMIEIFKLHDLNKKDLRLKMMELSKRWSPYRTYVCLHLWNFSGFKN